MNLIIGNTSQQSYYYPDDYVRISSRNIDFNFLKQNKFDSIYVTFAEQRIYDNNIDYINPNFLQVLKIIESVLDNTNKIVLFTSCELWTNKTGLITLDTNPDFNVKNEYTISKLLLFNEIKRLRKIDDRYNKVILIHPFYFNSCKRSPYFLFGKIYNSIIKKEKISTANLNFYRDIIHVKFLVKQCISLKQDSMMGCGQLINIKNYVVDLYNSFGLDFNEFVNEDTSTDPTSKLIYPKVDWIYTYQDLLNDTIEDIQKNY
jgi:hypothetical protein